MFIAHYHFPVRIRQTERQAAELRTLSPVSTASEASMTNIALAAIADAKRTMHENLQQNLRTSFVNTMNILQRQFTRQHHLPETGFCQETHLLHRTVIHLGTGVQRNRRQIQAGDSHILHNQCINTRTIQIPDHSLRFLQFLFFQNRIDRDVNPGIIQMGMSHQSRYIFQ